MTSSDQEIVTIVDRHNRWVDAIPRPIMRSRNLIHRAASILVFNRSNELFLQKRVATKDLYPGYWDIAAGGVVLAGETYEQCAHRELREELGIPQRLPLSFRFLQYYEDRQTRVWAAVFTCRHDGPFTLQQEEIDSGKFLALAALQELAVTEPVTPDGLAMLQRLHPSA